jgi:hypothetical protein
MYTTNVQCAGSGYSGGSGGSYLQGFEIAPRAYPEYFELARAVRRPTLRVDFESIVGSDPELMEKLEQRWRRDDKDL